MDDLVHLDQLVLPDQGDPLEDLDHLVFMASEESKDTREQRVT